MHGCESLEVHVPLAVGVITMVHFREVAFPTRLTRFPAKRAVWRAQPSKIVFVWLLSGTFVPDSSQKEEMRGRLRRPARPRRASLQ
jgi:hypothetical protein